MCNAFITQKIEDIKSWFKKILKYNKDRDKDYDYDYDYDKYAIS